MCSLPASSTAQGSPALLPGKALQGRPAWAGMTPRSPSLLQGKGGDRGQPEPTPQGLVPAHAQGDKLHSCAKGNREWHATATFRPDASYTDPLSLSLITLKCQFWQRAIDIRPTRDVLYHLYLSLPPISRELFPPNGFGKAFCDLVWMIPLLLKD